MARAGEGAVTLTRPSSLPGTVHPGRSVSDLTPALYAWNGLFIPQGGQRGSEREPKSLASILVILGGCCAPGRPVWPQWQMADQSWKLKSSHRRGLGTRVLDHNRKPSYHSAPHMGCGVGWL